MITFQILGPEPKASIFVNVKGDKTGAAGDVEWVDRKAPTPAGKTPDAALFRHRGDQSATIAVWHSDVTEPSTAVLLAGLQRTLDACMAPR